MFGDSLGTLEALHGNDCFGGSTVTRNRLFSCREAFAIEAAGINPCLPKLGQPGTVGALIISNIMVPYS